MESSSLETLLWLAASEQPLSTLPLDEVVGRLQRDGAILFRGFGVDVPGFVAFARKIAPTAVHNESPSRQRLDEETSVQTVDGGSDAFPLHPELSREPWKPDIAMFCCVQPPVRGGETTICDGIAIVEGLDADVRALWAGRRLVYVQSASAAQLLYWLGTERPSPGQLANPPAGCPYRFAKAGGGIIRLYQAPALHRPLFDDRLAFGNFALFARDYLKRPNIPLLDDGEPIPESMLAPVREAANRLTIDIPWQAGDVVLLDNSRWLHGRRAIFDARNRRIATYFGYCAPAPGQRLSYPDAPWRRADFEPPR